MLVDFLIFPTGLLAEALAYRVESCLSVSCGSGILPPPRALKFSTGASEFHFPHRSHLIFYLCPLKTGVSLKHRLRRNFVYQALSVVLNRVCILRSGFPFPYRAALQFEQLSFMLSSQTHPPDFPAHRSSWVLGSEDWPRVKCISLLHHYTDARGRSRCVCQGLWYSRQHIKTWISFNSLCSGAGRQIHRIDTLWFLCSYVPLHSVFIPSEHFWTSIVVVVFFSNESRKIVYSLLIFSTVAMLNCSPGILLKPIQDLNFHSL